MKKNKDPRINAGYMSIKDYLLLLLGFSAFFGFHMWLFVHFMDSGLLETNVRRVINILMTYTIITAALFMVSIAAIRHVSWNRPMRTISEAAGKIAQGDYSILIPSFRKDGKKDYIEVMIDDFNTMTKELAATHEKLTDMATTDELTRLNNRRSFLEYMEIIWKQCHRLNLPVSLLMIDVDFFKKYNDSLGHLEGDKTLIAIAYCLKNQLKRETDFVARFGGEEFVCLLPYVEKRDAVNFANELVKSVEHMKIPHPESDHSEYVTISAGAASILPGENNSHTQLLDEADKALYMAKQSGRNRVEIVTKLQTCGSD